MKTIFDRMLMKKLLLTIFGLIAVCSVEKAYAQDWAIKTNLFYDATTTMNLGVEVALAEKWTFDFSGNWNPYQFKNNKKWKHWLVQPEARYWLCHRFDGHFFAAHLVGGQYNIGNVHNLPDFLGTPFSQLEDYRFYGWFAGAGVGYGYAWMLGKHWNLEAEIGLGYAHAWYDQYECRDCSDKIGSGGKNYWGITKLSISFVYLF